MKPKRLLLLTTMFSMVSATLLAQEEPETELLTVEHGVVYDSDNRTLTDKVTKCSISLPMPPTSNLKRAKTPYGAMMIRTHSVDLGDMKVTLTQTKYPDAMLKKSNIDLEKDAAKFVEMATNYGMMQRKGSKVQSQRKVTLQGSPGVEQAVAYPDDENGAYVAGLIVGRTYVHNGLLYVVMVDLTKDEFEKDPAACHTKVTALLDSFAFLAE